MDQFIKNGIDFLTTYGGKIVIALLVLIIGPTGPQFTGAGLDSTPEHNHQTSTPGICNLLSAHWLLAAVTISGLAGCSFWLLVLTKSAH